MLRIEVLLVLVAMPVVIAFAVKVILLRLNQKFSARNCIEILGGLLTLWGWAIRSFHGLSDVTKVPPLGTALIAFGIGLLLLPQLYDTMGVTKNYELPRDKDNA